MLVGGMREVRDSELCSAVKRMLDVTRCHISFSFSQDQPAKALTESPIELGEDVNGDVS